MSKIGKYYLAIGSTPILRVSQLRVYKIARQENRVESFAGTACVDRSALKYKLTANIALCNAAEKNAIVAAAENVISQVSFYDGATLVTKNMIISMPEVPQAIYKYGVMSNGVYYVDLVVEMEEV